MGHSAPSPDRTGVGQEGPPAQDAQDALDALDARGEDVPAAPAALDAHRARRLAAAATRRVGALYAIPSAVEDFTTWRAAYAPQTALADLLTLVLAVRSQATEEASEKFQLTATTAFCGIRGCRINATMSLDARDNHAWRMRGEIACAVQN